MKTALFAGVAAAVLTAALPVLAAPAPPDTSAAGAAHVITFAQAKAAADTLWDRMDVNHDGKVDAADHDARLLERFAKWDTNHDGVISKDEFLARARAREEQWHGRHPDGPDGWHKGEEGHPGHDGPGRRPGGIVAMAIIAPAFHDARQQGVITRVAFDAAVKARFDTLDANHDGTVTREELRAAWHSGWGHHRHDRDDGPDHDGADRPPPPAIGQ